MEKGSQCVGMNECSRDTVAMPPIVDASSAVHRSLPTPPPPSISWFDSAAVRADLRSEVWPMGEGKKRVEGKANGASRGTEIPTYFSPFCKEIRQLGPAETYVVLRAGLRYFCVIWTRHVAGWPRCGVTSNKSCHIRRRISLSHLSLSFSPFLFFFSFLLTAAPMLI
jgi:hypothetical protein